ncbi:MAG: 5-bromo-4-chloroindolyl phosphate hydrolysis family protein [Eggerthellaceae bacterium]|jgi:5-bromo-4-chloroindolyl phosphate hydrolysis protein
MGYYKEKTLDGGLVTKPKNIGDQIGDAVQDALEHQDFSKIQDMVLQGVSFAAKGIGEGISQAAETSRKMYEEYQRAQAARLAQDQQQNEFARIAPSRFANTNSMKVSGIIMTTLGAVFSLAFGTTAFIALIGALVDPTDLLGIPAAALFALAGASVGVTIVGGSRIGLSSRFSNYVKAIGTSESIPLDNLSHKVGRPKKNVEKDVEKMIGKDLFIQAHLDSEEDILFLTDNAYKDYQGYREEAARKQAREQLRQQAASKRAQERPLTAEEQARLNQGRELLRQIDARTPDLGSDDAKKKAQALHVVAENIFNRAEQDPDVIEDLDQLVDYYLPLTVKLLDAYAELAEQPIQSDSIGTSRREIESTLDTLVHAFAKLHDSLFQEMTWDVSTDISVLNAVLAQDGLTEDPFDKKAGGSK